MALGFNVLAFLLRRNCPNIWSDSDAWCGRRSCLELLRLHQLRGAGIVDVAVMLPSAFVNNLKTVTSRLLRKEFADHLKRVYWSKPVFWSRSYCIFTVGGVPLSVLKQYIEQQERPE